MEQAYLEKLFPGGRELPNDRLIPAILMKGEQTEVIFLIKAEDKYAELLRSGNDSRVLHSDISVHQVTGGSKETGGGVPDLRIGLELSYPEEVVRYQGLISDASGQKQSSIVQALLLVNRIAVFVSTHDLQFRSFKAFDWNPAALSGLQKELGGHHAS
jgi:hypothetical protein